LIPRAAHSEQHIVVQRLLRFVPRGFTGKDSAREVREYFIPDFSYWKDHDSYRKAFERLVRDLTAEAAPTSPAHGADGT